MQTNFSEYGKRMWFLVILLLVCPDIMSQTDQTHRWSLSVNNDRAPLEIMMDIGEQVNSVTYLFDISRDTLNLSFVGDDDRDWKKRRLSIFALPRNKEVLRLKLDQEDLSQVKVVFQRMWNAMPRGFKNVLTLFELRESGVIRKGEEFSYTLIRFKMKPPRHGGSLEL